MSTQLPVGLKRRTNLFVTTTSPEDNLTFPENEATYDYNHHGEGRTEPITRAILERPLNFCEKIAFAVLSIFVYFGQIFADFYFWNQTKNQLLLLWSVHRIALLVITLTILFQTFTLVGPRTWTFNCLIEYEKVSSIAYHSFQFNQVVCKYFAKGTLDAESIYHVVSFIFVAAYLCGKKYKCGEL